MLSATTEPAGGGLPKHCDVKGYVAANVGIHLLLPADWNGKLLKLGCAGHCGATDSKYLPMKCSEILHKGYACLTSDMGHSGDVFDALWAQGDLQAKFDWGLRGTHVATLAGKAIVARYYSEAPKKSYFVGCSTGGRQGLQLDDGVRDDIIGDPLHCDFDPSALLCDDRKTQGCLTSAKVAAAKAVYAGPMTSAGVRLTLGGPLPGSERGGWGRFLARPDTPAEYERLTTDALRFLFFSPEAGPAWQLADFDFDRDYKRLGLMQSLYDSSNVDLRKFKQTGSKLLVFQGMNDDAVLPRDVVDYYETVERLMGGRAATADFFRLFLLPGVGHCSGGNGADAVDYLGAIEAWVEGGVAPDKLVAAKMKERQPARPFWIASDPKHIEFTRPLYPYPGKAKYKGSGNPNDAANFLQAPQ